MKVEGIRTTDLTKRLSDRVKRYSDETAVVAEDAVHFDLDKQKKDRGGSPQQQQHEEHPSHENKPESEALNAHRAVIDLTV